MLVQGFYPVKLMINWVIGKSNYDSISINLTKNFRDWGSGFNSACVMDP